MNMVYGKHWDNPTIRYSDAAVHIHSSKIGVLMVGVFTGRPTALLERESNLGVLLWISRNF